MLQLTAELLLLIFHFLPTQSDKAALMCCSSDLYSRLSGLLFHTIVLRSHAKITSFLDYVTAAPGPPRFAPHVRALYICPRNSFPFCDDPQRVIDEFRWLPYLYVRLRELLGGFENLGTLLVPDQGVIYSTVAQKLSSAPTPTPAPSPAIAARHIPNVAIFPFRHMVSWLVVRDYDWNSQEQDSCDAGTLWKTPVKEWAPRALAHTCLHFDMPTACHCLEDLVDEHGPRVAALAAHNNVFRKECFGPEWGPKWAALRRLEVQSMSGDVPVAIKLFKQGYFANVSVLIMRNLLPEREWKDWSSRDQVRAHLKSFSASTALDTFIDHKGLAWLKRDGSWKEAPGFRLPREWYEAPS